MKNSFENFQFVPYEELQVEVKARNQFHFSTPWLSMNVEAIVSDEVYSNIIFYSEKKFERVDLRILSDLLKSLNLPYNYILPLGTSPDSGDTHELPATNLPSIAKCTKTELKKYLGIQHSVNSSLYWNWDVDAILSMSHAGNRSYLPISILSIVRRFHLLDCMDYDKTRELYDFCQKSLALNEPHLNQILGSLVMQNYFVTAECQNSLRPALTIAQSSTNQLIDFMEEEEGHDLLMLRALSSLEQDSSQLILTESVKNIMAILKKIWRAELSRILPRSRFF